MLTVHGIRNCDTVKKARAVALMIAHPSAIRRPIVTGLAHPLVGFKPGEYATRFERLAKP